MGLPALLYALAVLSCPLSPPLAAAQAGEWPRRGMPGGVLSLGKGQGDTGGGLRSGPSRGK